MTSGTRTTAPAVAALRQRLRAVADVLVASRPDPLDDAAEDAHNLLRALVERARSSLVPAEAWLLHAAVTGHLPMSDDVAELLRQLELAPTDPDAERWLLRRGSEVVAELGWADRELRVLDRVVLVDVSFSAQNDKHTGIQRVTREVCSRWAANRDIVLAAWNPGQTALRALAPVETERVLRFAHTRTVPHRDGAAPATAMLVPWRSTVVLPEVAQGTTSRPLAALAQHSGNAVVTIGYDAIPVTSADMRPVAEPDQFVGYLTVVKHARKVAGISRSAAAEFRGFAEAVRAQGLPGPQVTEVMLAAEVPPAPDRGHGADGGPGTPADVPARPNVLCVGSHELHKNHLALLHAAELLWRRGLEFDLTFAGGVGWDTRTFDAVLADLERRGRAVRNVGSVTDDELWALYRGATFTVFPSLHEGFGLPVAESLACGTPAITTVYGSTGEIAERGGCLLVDPRDDHDLEAAMHTLLTEPATYRRLKDEALRSEGRTWDTYAEELWGVLVDHEGVQA